MLHLVAGSGSTSHARISTLRGIHGTGEILILAHVGLLHLRFSVLHERSGNSMVHRAFWEAVSGVRVRAVWRHRWRDIPQVGIWDRVWINIVVLRRYVVIRRIVSRHDSVATKKALRDKAVVVGDKKLAEV